ncbi:hypothetical protein GCM10023310_15820 [Paenibacillus vulneris]|uniref:GNAT family N-acetyltransferase n=1 Tax=Paenibacillus vulneris TaxID=1133364 RepID=A0ABW3UIU0_9BACL
MEAALYHSSHSKPLYKLVHDHIIQIPPYIGITFDEFLTILHNPCHMTDKIYGSFERNIVTLVGIVNGGLFAAAQITFPVKSEDGDAGDTTEAILNWLFADRCRQHDTASFYKAILQVVNDKGYQRLTTSRNPFGSGWSGIPDAWPHLLQAMSTATSTVDIWDSYWFHSGSREETISSLIEAEVTDNLPELQVHFQFFLGDQDLGEIDVWFPSEAARSLRQAGVADVEWIQVSEPYQGKRYGEKLLRYAQAYCAGMGYPRLVLWTQEEPMWRLAARIGYDKGPRFHWITQEIAPARP